jgi:hypothetical protein
LPSLRIRFSDASYGGCKMAELDVTQNEGDTYAIKEWLARSMHLYESRPTVSAI